MEHHGICDLHLLFCNWDGCFWDMAKLVDVGDSAGGYFDEET